MHVRTSIIFDFDGTIADSFDVFLAALLATTKQRQPLTAEAIEDLRGSSSTKEVIKKLHVKPWQLPLFLLKGRRELSARYATVQVFPGMPEIIKDLAADYDVYILSTNSEENIRAFLEKYGLSKYIRQIYADIGIFSKAKSLKMLQKKEKLDPSRCVYVGDETRDIEAAHKADIKCIAVSWGYNLPGALRAQNPDALASGTKALRAIMNKINELTRQ